MEAEVKSEATGGRVNVETKDQKVWLPPFPGISSSASPTCSSWKACSGRKGVWGRTGVRG